TRVVTRAADLREDYRQRRRGSLRDAARVQDGGGDGADGRARSRRRDRAALHDDRTEGVLHRQRGEGDRARGGRGAAGRPREVVARYSNRILNIHPSLLPAFPGVDAQWQAVAYGVKISGCTVHFVTEKLDDGPILVQRCVEVRDDDTGDTLAARILAEEHAAYVEALRKLAGNTAA